ncbi:hypothetical protein L1047_09495 [Synechococcus sp. Nb3U1]|uniref:hypothetical protein n=1 Tax=Synechococcus sp. Nb3U1 TaxID=1914529 RepID=UPI001F1BDF0E|nr:hypothetical protein [Synechococcus sp. Nb3U1]MCF2971426.1 hypothetical protein [Synechococcus sp. Nb3U1]
MSKPLDPQSDSSSSSSTATAADPAASESANGSATSPAAGLNWEELLRQLEASWQELPQRSEETVQQTLARLQLEWGGLCREARDRLQKALEAAEATGSLQPIPAEIRALLPLLNPSQWEVVIASLARASDRALVASLLFHWGQEQPHPETPTDGIPSVLSPDQCSSLETMSARAYGNSRMPLVMDKSGQIQVKASAALLATLIAIEIGSVGSAGALSLLGTPELRKLLSADGKLRQTGLKQGRTALTEEEWQTLRRWLDPKGSPPSNDWYLNLTQLGIQTTQVGDYVARRLREFFQSEWIKLLIPPLYHLVIDAMRLLTGEVFLSVGTTLESALESAEAGRRLELVLQALPQARNIPTPERIQAAIPAVTEAAEKTLKPLLARQLMAVADTFDPPIRNEGLNELGRQLNLWNPFQFLLTWSSAGWLEALLDQIQQLQTTYPEMPLWESYGQGIEAAAEASRVMDQAEALRLTAKSLDPKLEQPDD